MTNQSATDQLAHPGWEAQKPDVFHSIIVCMGATVIRWLLTRGSMRRNRP